MLEDLLGGLFDKEKAIYTTVQDTLVRVAEELNVTVKEIFIMIRPKDEDGNHAYYICKYDDKGNPKPIREISLKEILE